MSLLDAATDDLASLINRLDLEATPRTPDVSPFGSAQRSLGNRESTSTLESPLTHSKRIRTATGSQLRAALLYVDEECRARVFGGLGVDEVHVVHEWAEGFQKDYREPRTLQIILGDNVHLDVVPHVLRPSSRICSRRIDA